jgi:hypothetical protein
MILASSLHCAGVSANIRDHAQPGVYTFAGTGFFSVKNGCTQNPE